MFVNREVKHVDNEPGSLRPVTSVDTDRSPTPYKVSIPEPVETPVVTENYSPVVPPAVLEPHRDEGVQLEGFRDNIAEVPDAHPPAVPPAVIKDPPTVSPAVLQSHPGEGVNLERFRDKITEVPDAHPPVVPPVIIKDPPTVPPVPTLSHVIRPEWMSTSTRYSNDPVRDLYNYLQVGNLAPLLSWGFEENGPDHQKTHYAIAKCESVFSRS